MRRATRKKPEKKTKKWRASWKGQLTFGLVSLPVEAFNALNREGSDIHFHQLHEKCHRRIQYQKVCPTHGEITNDEIVSGYEYQKGKYIEIEPTELDQLRTEAERALKLDAFVSPEVVDPIFFDGRMYYLVPSDEGAIEPYSVIVAAMQREERYGIGQLVFSGKEQVVLIRPLDGVLHMAMLNYDAEIRTAKSVAGNLPKHTSGAREVRVAQSLIEQLSDDNFDFAQYQDDYREQLQKLIQAKLRGHKITPPEEEEEEPVVLNLMDALKQSLELQKKGKRRGRARTA